jgi:L-ascorbate metabolism protein UlaG (beta-lactamase superfamily)
VNHLLLRLVDENAKKEYFMSVTVQWLGHASFRISQADEVIYIDPWKISGQPKDATLVLVSHSHYDHYSSDDIIKISTADTKIFASGDVIDKYGGGLPMKPGQTIETGGVAVTATAAYNPAKQFHPKDNKWLGFVLEVGSKRIFYAGDTDFIEEMKGLENIDLALLPVGGTYTMNAEEAGGAVECIRPKQALPYHWGDIVGSSSDADTFAGLADCAVTILGPSDSMTLE